MKRLRSAAVVVFGALLGVIQGLQAQPAASSATICDHPAAESRFDPACYIRIYEDSGNGKRKLLYDQSQQGAHSRLLRADPESTIVIDMAKAFDASERGDVALNKLLVGANLKTKDSTHAVEVTGYSQIGQSAANSPAQVAFAFQTFDNVQGKVQNLYFTAKDLIDKTYGDSQCSMAMLRAQHPENVPECQLDAKDREERLVTFGKGLAVFAPEAEALSDFFSSAGNRAVEAKLAIDIFEIDLESLQGIASQFKTQRARLADNAVPDAEKQTILETLLERTRLALNDFSGVAFATRRIACTAKGDNTPDCQLKLQEVCPGANSARTRVSGLGDPDEFSRTCLAEFKRKDYIEHLRTYLVEGTIDLAKNDAASGDILTLTLEAQGPDQQQTGARAEFRIRVANYGWKAGVEPSLFFVKRIGVNEADANRPSTSPIKSLQPVRFSPFPGVNLAASYYGSHTAKASFLHILAPGLGVNATFMTFGAKRDFDPLANNGAGQFTTVNGSSFELGTGPVVSLFGNRISVTYGWNLMASDRRTYWALGFGFLSLGKDLAGLIKKN